MATKIVNSLAGLPAEVTVKKLVKRSNYDELWISGIRTYLPTLQFSGLHYQGFRQELYRLSFCSPSQIDPPAYAA